MMVCFSCGDQPITDHRIANAAEAISGVPSLRLCDDCAGIRQGFGGRLGPLGRALAISQTSAGDQECAIQWLVAGPEFHV